MYLLEKCFHFLAPVQEFAFQYKVARVIEAKFRFVYMPDFFFISVSSVDRLDRLVTALTDSFILSELTFLDMKLI